MKQTSTRKLEETSWLAQSIYDRMENADQETAKYKGLSLLKFLVNNADNPGNTWGIRYEKNDRTGEIEIWVKEIPYGMQPDFLGISSRYKDDEGMNILEVLVTH